MKNFRALLAAVSVAVFLVGSARAEIADWDSAVRPLDEGVPQVAVMRLRNILKRSLVPDDHLRDLVGTLRHDPREQ